jgi:hypothetical protein
MSNKQAKEMAQQFLKEQAKIIGKYGTAPKLTGDRYQEALTETHRVFQSLSAQRDK